MCMVLYHAMFTVGFIFNAPLAQDMFRFFSFISPAFAFAFIMMCGISCNLSHSNLKRGTLILCTAFGVTAVSLFVTPDFPIFFGILHLLGASVLFYSFVCKPLCKIPAAAGIAVSLLLFFLFYNIPQGYLGFDGFFRIFLPPDLYRGGLMSVFGFIGKGEAYGDYFPLLPWFFAFLTGVFTGRLFKDGFPKFTYKSRLPFLSLLGTNAFLVYVIHQPIIYGVSYILTLVFGGK